ncbi:MAG: hypothetical protein ACRDSR_17280 [Pseudonocardiaceae bacterium]
MSRAATSPCSATCEQVTDSALRGLLPSQLHQQGQVVGRALESLYVVLVRYRPGVVGETARIVHVVPLPPGAQMAVAAAVA